MSTHTHDGGSVPNAVRICPECGSPIPTAQPAVGIATPTNTSSATDTTPALTETATVVTQDPQGDTEEGGVQDVTTGDVISSVDEGVAREVESPTDRADSRGTSFFVPDDSKSIGAWVRGRRMRGHRSQRRLLRKRVSTRHMRWPFPNLRRMTTRHSQIHSHRDHILGGRTRSRDPTPPTPSRRGRHIISPERRLRRHTRSNQHHIRRCRCSRSPISHSASISQEQSGGRIASDILRDTRFSQVLFRIHKCGYHHVFADLLSLVDHCGASRHVSREHH